MLKRMMLSIVSLILGIIIYYIFKYGVIANNTIFVAFIRNFIPDFLWIFSFYFFGINVTKKIFTKYIILTAIYSALLGIAFEILQKMAIIKGTFDFYDILTYMISIWIACQIELFFRRKENENIKN